MTEQKPKRKVGCMGKLVRAGCGSILLLMVCAFFIPRSWTEEANATRTARAIMTSDGRNLATAVPTRVLNVTAIALSLATNTAVPTLTSGFTPEVVLRQDLPEEMYITKRDNVELYACADRRCEILLTLMPNDLVPVRGVINGQSVVEGNAVWYIAPLPSDFDREVFIYSDDLELYVFVTPGLETRVSLGSTAAARQTATAPTPDIQPLAQTTYYTTGRANLRSCPETTCDVMQTLNDPGIAVIVDGEIEGEIVNPGNSLWYRTQTTVGDAAYIYSGVVSLQRAQPAATTQQSQSAAPIHPTQPVAAQPRNCDEARAMGLTAEQAAQAGLDRDGDGVACYEDN